MQTNQKSPMTAKQIEEIKEWMAEAEDDIAKTLEVLDAKTIKDTIPLAMAIMAGREVHPSQKAILTYLSLTDACVIVTRELLSIATVEGDEAARLRSEYAKAIETGLSARMMFMSSHVTCDGSCGHHPKISDSEVDSIAEAWTSNTHSACLGLMGLSVKIKLRKAAELMATKSAAKAEDADLDVIRFTELG